VKFAVQYIACVLLIWMFSGLANAEDEFDPYACADADFREAFGTSNYQQTRPSYRRGLPDFLANLELPKSIALVGSQFSGRLGHQQTRIIFKVEGDKDAGLEAGIAMLEQSGWEFSRPDLSSSRGGFTAGLRQNFVYACRADGPGVLSVSTRNSKIGALLELGVSSGKQFQSCTELQSSEPDSFELRSLERFLPDLSLPQGATGSGYGSGGGGGEYHSSASISYGASLESLLSFLGDQIDIQGWESEGQWSATSASGTTWSRSAKDAGELVGQLTAIETSSETYDVRFSVIAASRR